MANNLQQSSNAVTSSSIAVSLAMSSRESLKSSEKRQAEDIETVKIVGTMQALSQMTDAIAVESLGQEQEGEYSCSSSYYQGGNGTGNGDDNDKDDDTTSEVISTSNSVVTDEDGNTVTTTSTTTEYTTTTTTTDEDGNIVVTTSSYTEEVTTVVVTDEDGTVLSSDTTTEDKQGTTSVTTTTINEDGTTTTTYTTETPIGFSASTSGHGIMGGSSVGLSIASLNHAQDTLLGVDLAWLEQNRLTFQAGTLFAKYEREDMMDSAEKQRQAGYFEAAQYFSQGAAAGVGVCSTMYSSRSALGSLKTSNDEIAQHKKTLDLLDRSNKNDVDTRAASRLVVGNSPENVKVASVQRIKDKVHIAAVKHNGDVDAGLDQVFGKGKDSMYLTDADGKVLDRGGNSHGHMDAEGYALKPNGTRMDRFDTGGRAINRDGKVINTAGGETGSVAGAPVKRVKDDGCIVNDDGATTTIQAASVRKEEIIAPNEVDPRSMRERCAPEILGGKQNPNVVIKKSGISKFREEKLPEILGGRPTGVAEERQLNYRSEAVEDSFARMPEREKNAFRANTQAKLDAAEKTRSEALNQFNANVTWNNMFWSSCIGGIFQGGFKIASADKQKEATEAATWSKYEGSQSNQLFSAASNWQSQANTAYQQSLSVLGGTLDALRRATNRS